MHLHFSCPSCSRTHQDAEVMQAGDGLSCQGCGWSKTLDAQDWSGAAPTRCLLCGNDDLWRQKCLPPGVGLFCVATQIILSTIAWYYYAPLWTYGILMVFALLDMVLFWVLPDVLVCYRCQAQHHAGELGEHGHFDHQTAEKYRQEAIRLKSSTPG